MDAIEDITALLAEIEHLTIKNNFYSVAITEKIGEIERLNRRIELLGGISSAPEAGP